VSDQPFRLEEATIAELHAAIRAGKTTCVAVVRHYIERARERGLADTCRARQHDGTVQRGRRQRRTVDMEQVGPVLQRISD
jgi:Asp-tRNA(Asn)/Glu-tRNA(Gln) amidotransferase A subunit family amidase